MTLREMRLLFFFFSYLAILMGGYVLPSYEWGSEESLITLGKLELLKHKVQPTPQKNSTVL